jgi:hypothetical protein
LEDHAAGWYQNQTVVHPVGLAALLVMCVLVLVLPRRYAVLPLFLLASLVPSAQRVVIAGIDFSFMRILILVGWMRLVARGEHRGLAFTPLDYAFVGWALVGSVVYLAREASFSAFVWRAGWVVDALGLYFFFRCSIRGFGDLARLAQTVLIVAIPTALAFAVEWFTGHNAFSVMGGVPEFTVVREGRLRCQGAFQHPIIAGVFWATLLPIAVARWWQPGVSRALVAVGSASCLFVVAACSSSTPILVVAACLGGALLFPIRFHLRWLRWGSVATLVGLHLVMNKPVWHLMSRVSVVGGSTGYHRYLLTDAFIRSFRDWWLLGMSSTRQWGNALKDVTSVYILEGVRGGLATFVMLIVVLAYAFRQVGQVMRMVREERVKSIYAFSVGLCLFGHAVAMSAASYFGQLLVAWFLAFAISASLLAAVRAQPARVAREAAGRSAQPAPPDGADLEPPAAAHATLGSLLRPRSGRGHPA